MPAFPSSLQTVFQPLQHHLAAAAILQGSVAASLFADDPVSPRAALLKAGHRALLAGLPSPELISRLARHFLDDVYPAGQQAGEELFILYPAPNWEPFIADILPGKDPIPTQREYYELCPSGPVPFDGLPGGLTLRAVDAALLAEDGLEGMDDLREEMVSERASVEDFLQHSFGFIALSGKTLAGWCLSEYNTPEACEFGIAALPGFRQNGLATALARACMAEGQRRGLMRFGWHCFADNTPSVATALRLGFQKKLDYPAWLAFYDEGVSLAVNGRFCLDRGDPAAARIWYQKALDRGGASPWIDLGMARAAAAIGQPDEAFVWLNSALEKGFHNRDDLLMLPQLITLQADPRWGDLLAKMA